MDWRVTAFGLCKSTWPQNAKFGENIDKFPLAPSKKGVIWTMRYMFVSGHVGCKEIVFAAHKFRCHYKQLWDLEFSTSLSIRVFRLFRGKKNSSYTYFWRAIMCHFVERGALYHAAKQYLTRFLNKKLGRPWISPEIVVFTKGPCLGPSSGGIMYASTPILHFPVEGH